MHTAVRLQNPGAEPPKLECSRISPDQVVIVYKSSRKLCPIGKGIIKGIAEHYNDKVTIIEPECMLRGGAQCRLQVKQGR
jgi:predicted hydrocarbon binding protein